MSDNRPPVPSNVKRVLRQEAYFGCCICGNPVMQYHHIVPFGVEEHFRPSDMMALCPNHHDEANNLVISEPEQRNYKASPFNKERGYSKGALSPVQRNSDVVLGGHTFSSGNGDLLRVGLQALITVNQDQNGTFLLSVRLYDADDALLAEIIDNEWISHDPRPWDIEYRYRELHIRQAKGDIALSVDCRKAPVLITGKLWRSGRLIRLTASGMQVDQAKMVGGGTIQGGIIELDDGSAGTQGFRIVGRHQAPTRREHQKVGRNTLCFCGSGLKYKRCHGK